MKKFAVLTLIVGALGAYAWYAIIVPEKQKTQKLSETVVESAEGLTGIRLSKDQVDIHMEIRDGLWWVTKPHEYLANQEFIDKAVKIMVSTPVFSQFDKEQSSLKKQTPEALVEWDYQSGLKRRIQILKEQGPKNSIYLEDLDSKVVYAVHNVWGQMLYFAESHFYHPYLPIPGHQVKTIELNRDGKTQWKVTPAKNNKIDVVFHATETTTDRAPWLWFFKKVREFSVENIEFDTKRTLDGAELLVETEKGNIKFVFDEKTGDLWIPQLNVFAHSEPYSLRSLGNEIEKVINSDKK